MFERVDAEVAACHACEQAEEALKWHEVEQWQAQEVMAEASFVKNGC